MPVSDFSWQCFEICWEFLKPVESYSLPTLKHRDTAATPQRWLFQMHPNMANRTPNFKLETGRGSGRNYGKLHFHEVYPEYGIVVLYWVSPCAPHPTLFTVTHKKLRTNLRTVTRDFCGVCRQNSINMTRSANQCHTETYANNTESSGVEMDTRFCWNMTSFGRCFQGSALYLQQKCLEPPESPSFPVLTFARYETSARQLERKLNSHASVISHCLLAALSILHHERHYLKGGCESQPFTDPLFTKCRCICPCPCSRWNVQSLHFKGMQDSQSAPPFWKRAGRVPVAFYVQCDGPSLWSGQ